MRAAIYARVGNPDQLAVRNQTEVLTGQIRGIVGTAEGIMEAVSGILT